MDVANLRQPISTTITGMKQAISVLNSGSVEAKNALLHESNVIYECRVCLSMFRNGFITITWILHQIIIYSN